MKDLGYVLFAYVFCFFLGLFMFLKGYKMYRTKKCLLKLKNRIIKDEVKLSKYEGVLVCVGSIIYITIVIAMFASSPYDDAKSNIFIGLLIGWCIVDNIIHFIILNLYTTKKKSKS